MDDLIVGIIKAILSVFFNVAWAIFVLRVWVSFGVAEAFGLPRFSWMQTFGLALLASSITPF